MRLEFDRNKENYVNVGDAGVIYRVRDERDVVKAGRISEVRLYDTELTQTQIQNI